MRHRLRAKDILLKGCYWRRVVKFLEVLSATTPALKWWPFFSAGPQSRFRWFIVVSGWCDIEIFTHYGFCSMPYSWSRIGVRFTIEVRVSHADDIFFPVGACNLFYLRRHLNGQARPCSFAALSAAFLYAFLGRRHAQPSFTDGITLRYGIRRTGYWLSRQGLAMKLYFIFEVAGVIFSTRITITFYWRR